LLLWFVLALVAPQPAWAGGWKERKQARKAASAGKAAVRKGDFEKAARKYKLADTLVPAPSYKLELGRVLIELGDLLQAGDVLREASEVRARQWAEKVAVQKSKRLLKEVEERTPTLTVVVAKPEASSVTVFVDGNDFEPADGAVPFNPGSYEVEAEAPGYERWSSTVKLDESQPEKVSIALTKSGAVEKEEVEEEGGGMGYAPAYVAWGVALVGVGVGIGFGVAAIQTTNEVIINYGCDSGECPPEAAEDLDVAKTNGNVSTAGFIIGGVAAVAGTVLFLMADPDDDDSGADADDQEEEAAVKALPLIGPGFVGVHGTF
jgi:hypothetical protein